MEKKYKVVMSCGSLCKDTGIEGTYEECEEFCESLEWVSRPEYGLEWDLEIEEDD